LHCSDGAFQPTDAAWTVTSGSLPGLSLVADGMISGTPTAVQLNGSNFQVTASYKNKSVGPVYTIKVGKALLEAKQAATGSNHTCAMTTSGGVSFLIDVQRSLVSSPSAERCS
jgi:Putative Ig domain